MDNRDVEGKGASDKWTYEGSDYQLWNRMLEFVGVADRNHQIMKIKEIEIRNSPIMHICWVSFSFYCVLLVVENQLEVFSKRT